MLRKKRILVTESSSSQLRTADYIRQSGGVPVMFPLISITRAENREPLNRALDTLHRYDWVLFTSSNAVRSFFRHAEAREVTQRTLDAVRYGVVGPGTAKTVSEFGREVTFTPGCYNGRALGREIPFRRGARFLLPQGNIAGTDLCVILRGRGARVDTIEAYRTVANGLDEKGRHELEKGVDAILFSSGSAVHSFLQAVPNARLLGREAPIGCIGSATADVVRASGMSVAFTGGGTAESLCKSLVEYFRSGYKGEQSK